MVRAGLSHEELAALNNSSKSTIKKKFSGKVEWKRGEMERTKGEINRRLGTNYTADYLFDIA
jgi:hypothetical protein